MADYYSRTYAFAERTTARGSEVKEELDSISSGFQGVSDDLLRSILLPTGANGNITQSVGERAFSVLGFDENGDIALLDGVGRWKGDWTPDTDYNTRDIVRDADGALGLGNIYISTEDHTSGTGLDDDESKWAVMIDVTDVKASELAAAASAADALAHKNSASSSASSASTSASNASESATTATTKAISATASALTATTAANNASNSASTATDKADEASDSAAEASASATTASSAETVAQAAQAAAELAYEAFDAKYLGAKSSAPTTDNEGEPLINGAAFFDTTVSALKIYNSSTELWSTISIYTHPNHTGDVTSTGDGNTLIANGAVTMAKMASIATSRLIGRVTAGTGVPELLTATQVRALLNVSETDINTAKTNTVQVFTKAQRGVVTVLTDQATITDDLSKSNFFSVTLAGNRTLGNFTNVVAGQSGSIFITQDATGGRSLAYASDWKFAGGNVPTLSTEANAVDRLDYVVKTSGQVHCSLSTDIK